MERDADDSTRAPGDATLRTALGRFGVDAERAALELLDSALDAIVTVDAEHRVVFFNRAAEHVFGVPAREVIGGRLDRFIPPEARARHEAGMRRMADEPRAARKVPRAVPLRGVRADGTVFPIEATVSVSTTPDGARLYTAILRDVSEREAVEAERRRLEAGLLHARQLEVLAGGVAHDFNNILMSILGRAELALLEAPSGSRVAGDLAEIRQAAHRASDLVQQLLTYAGRASPGTPESVDLEALLAEVADALLSSRHGGGRLELDFARGPSEGPPRVLADPRLLGQVLHNVLLNAIEALPGEGGTVVVSTRPRAGRPAAAELVADAIAGPGPWCEITVRDSGRGMSEETLARIFDPFFTTKFPGRGLGLPAVLGIIRAARGAVGVTSSPGAGTSFRIYLPMAGEPGGRAADAPRAEWAGRGGMLVVDDEEVVRRIAGRMLEALGFTVYEASSAESALAVVARHRAMLRAALVDLTMPGVDGLETLERMQVEAPELVLVLTSGHAPEHVEARGTPHFIKKPFTVDQLRGLMRRLLP